MIKRTYFVSAKKLYNDGNGSYSFNYLIISHRSFLPQHSLVFEKALSAIDETLKSKPGKSVEVVSFTKL